MNFWQLEMLSVSWIRQGDREPASGGLEYLQQLCQSSSLAHRLTFVWITEGNHRTQRVQMAEPARRGVPSPHMHTHPMCDTSSKSKGGNSHQNHTSSTLKMFKNTCTIIVTISQCDKVSDFILPESNKLTNAYKVSRLSSILERSIGV